MGLRLDSDLEIVVVPAWIVTRLKWQLLIWILNFNMTVGNTS